MFAPDRKTLAALIPLSGLVLCIGMSELRASSVVRSLPVDRPAKVAGITVACTGVGFGEEGDARWKAYPARLEAVDARGQYLGDESVALRNRAGGEMMRVNCDAPWLMLKLKPGRYSATVTAENASANATRRVAFSVPATGQRNVVVRFSSIDQPVGHTG